MKKSIEYQKQGNSNPSTLINHQQKRGALFFPAVTLFHSPRKLVDTINFPHDQPPFGNILLGLNCLSRRDGVRIPR
ncbi:hypothetical protein Bpfe_024888 [Biomphalaria pfeifferi]|uniref:Uncharacterized protein n=1 Tax=Biomphalaria pfeifferi TaxID=112525 RepID=A0AAD8F0A3_BIOPF|nr:hypothetical protein Bpfe_024888 [Biomphalaria pfeifferi]